MKDKIVQYFSETDNDGNETQVVLTERGHLYYWGRGIDENGKKIVGWFEFHEYPPGCCPSGELAETKRGKP